MFVSISSSVRIRAALVLAGRIADLGRPAAHQHDRPVAGLLEPPELHDLDQAADVKARRGRVEADYPVTISFDANVSRPSASVS